MPSGMGADEVLWHTGEQSQLGHSISPIAKTWHLNGRE